MSRPTSRRPSGRPGTAPGRGVDGPVPAVGAREPCPCGSGRRYKACHGRERASDVPRRVARPFAGMPGEAEWVALREIVQAAVAEVVPAGVAADLAARDAVTAVRVATVLPKAAPGWRRADGTVFVSVQAAGPGLDAGREVAATLLAALAAAPGATLAPVPVGPDTPGLAEVLAPVAPTVVVTDGFGFWFDGWPAGSAPPDADLVASRERADSAIQPTAAVPGVAAAYLVTSRERTHLRWVLPYGEDDAVDALARLSAGPRPGLRLAEGRFLGVFRTCGLIVPVWELPGGAAAGTLAGPVRDLADDLAAAVAGPALDAAQRHTRAGILARQVTIR